MRKKAYTGRFFEEDMDSASSARVIVPRLIELVSPSSVVDVGCGRGEFLSVFIEEGISNILGIDGEWAGKENLKIPEKFFTAHDLEKPFSHGRKFSLVLSLEVAEHLREESSRVFIDTLASLGDAVVFSAAVPFQGGRNHFNEKWPAFWASLFFERGFLCFDCLREEFWDDERVSFWYSQNMLFFVRKEKAPDFPLLGEPVEKPLPLVHPSLYLKKCRKRGFFSFTSRI